MNDYLKVLLGAAGGALLALLLVGVFRGGSGYGMMGPMMGGGMMGGGLLSVLLGLLLWAALAALLVAAAVFVFTTLRRR